jgi:hypothetical protein
MWARGNGWDHGAYCRVTQGEEQTGGKEERWAAVGEFKSTISAQGRKGIKRVAMVACGARGMWHGSASDDGDGVGFLARRGTDDWAAWATWAEKPAGPQLDRTMEVAVWGKRKLDRSF